MVRPQDRGEMEGLVGDYWRSAVPHDTEARTRSMEGTHQGSDETNETISDWQLRWPSAQTNSVAPRET